MLFLQALPGKRVKIELHNDTLVEGTVESVSDSSDFALTGLYLPQAHVQLERNFVVLTVP